jgi:hypothetical protein
VRFGVDTGDPRDRAQPIEGGPGRVEFAPLLSRSGCVPYETSTAARREARTTAIVHMDRLR